MNYKIVNECLPKEYYRYFNMALLYCSHYNIKSTTINKLTYTFNFNEMYVEIIDNKGTHKYQIKRVD